MEIGGFSQNMMALVITALVSSFVTLILIACLTAGHDSDLQSENFMLQQDLETKELELKNKDREIENLHKKYTMDRMV